MAEQQTLFEQPQEQLERFHRRNPKLFFSYYLAFKLPQFALWQRIQVQAQKTFDRVKSKEEGKTFAEIKIFHIEQLPIRRIFFITPERERKQQVDELKALYHEILEPNGRK